MAVTTYANVSSINFGEVLGSPTDFLAWMTSDNNSESYTIWGLANETPAFYYSHKDLKRIVNIALHIRHYYAPILIACGCLGNALIILTILMTKLIKVPTMHFFLGIAIIDLCFLLSLFLWWIGSFSSTLTSVPGWCQFVTFTSHVCCFTSVWLFVALTLERYLSCTKDKCTRICLMWCAGGRCCQVPEPTCTVTCTCNTLRVKACIIGIFIVGVVVYVNICLTVDYVHIGPVAICVILSNFIAALQVLSKIDIFFNVFIPYFVILGLNARSLWVTIKSSHDRERALNRTSLSRAGKLFARKSEAHLVMTSCAMCVVFLLLNSPSQVLRVVYMVKDSLTLQSQISLGEYLTQQILQAFYYTRFSTNFLVLTASSRMFRKALKMLIQQALSKLRRLCHKERPLVPASTLQFTVEFSSTLSKLHETSLL